MQQQKPSTTQRDQKQSRRSYPRPARAEEMEPLYLRVPQILRRYGFSRSTFYKLVQQGTLPRPFHPTKGRMAVWSAADLDEAVERVRNVAQ